jgi:hypothetical protein
LEITYGSVNTGNGAMKKFFNTMGIGMFAAAIFIAAVIYVPQIFALIGFLGLSYIFGLAIMELNDLRRNK